MHRVKVWIASVRGAAIDWAGKGLIQDHPPSPATQTAPGCFPKRTWCTVRGGGWRSPREALDGQALASLFPPPGCPAFGVDALFDSVPVRFCDSKFIKEVTWKKTSQIKTPWGEGLPFGSWLFGSNLNTKMWLGLRAPPLPPQACWLYAINSFHLFKF